MSRPKESTAKSLFDGNKLFMLAIMAIAWSSHQELVFLADVFPTILGADYGFPAALLAMFGMLLALYAIRLGRAHQLAVEQNQELCAIIESEPECVKLLAADGTLLQMNRAGLRMVEADTLDQVVGQKIQQFIAPEFREAFMTLSHNVFSGGAGKLKFEMHGLKGASRWLEMHAVPKSNGDGQITALLAVSRDVTEFKQAEDELRIAAATFESQEGMVITDANNVILRVNRAFSEITGYSASEVIGKTPRLLKSGRHDDAFYAAMWEQIRCNGSWQGEIWNRRKNGDVYPEWLTITAVKGPAGTATHHVGTLTDISGHKEAENEIKHLAFYDPLTQLPNRRLLLDRLHQALMCAARSRRHGALLLIDLDNFKMLNDSAGHDKGDLLLQQVAKRLASHLRDGDTVARVGGDEFVVMLEDLSENAQEAATQTEIVGAKILAALNQPYDLEAPPYHGTPSIGVTLFSDYETSIDELMKHVDLAMYQAKAAGRNALRFFDPDMQAAVAARAALEADLRLGIREKQFHLYYQPQVDGTGHLTGAEALVRWQHPLRGMVSPAEFIPLAEETGLILPLGHWVLETACHQLVEWASQPLTAHLTVAVNVSARQFRHPDFVAQVLAILDHTGAEPRHLKLELTESLLLEDVSDTIANMAALKAHGVCFSLDDFGTGYSSLSYLKHLPLDQLKIDQSFVRDILTDPNDAVIAKTIIALGQSLGYSVIAEGVETSEQRELLARQGCHAYQGYLFGKPLPVDKFEALLGANLSALAPQAPSVRLHDTPSSRRPTRRLATGYRLPRASRRVRPLSIQG